MEGEGYKITKKGISEYLEKGKRFDGRDLFEHRQIEVKANISKNAEASVSVKMGKTEVIAGVKMDVAEPYTDHEEEGTMMTTLELLPLSSSEFDYGPPDISAIEIARIIDRGIRESGFIDFKKLCIKKGEKVWSVFIDISTINADGNLIDAGALASIIALRLAKIPVYDEKTEKVKHGQWTKDNLPLVEDKMPITITFHKLKENIFIDPTNEEEKAAEGRLTVEISEPKSSKEFMINAMQKGGEAPLTLEEIEKILKEAEKVFKNIKTLVEEEVKKAGK